MRKATRGFQHLAGVTIERADTTAINEVILFDGDGEHFYTIEAEAGPLGIPVIRLTKHRQVKYKQPTVRFDPKKAAA